VTRERERAAETEALFREVNERIAETADRFDAQHSEFQCECADLDCNERVEAPLAEYEDVRSDGATFILARGHEDQSIERIVRRRRNYAVVEKVDSVASRIVRGLDPRAVES
jgi:hypothetical protein